MDKRSVLPISLICFAALPASAQEYSPALHPFVASTSPSRLLRDDDGGKIEAIGMALAPAPQHEGTYHGGYILRAPRLEPVFLGGDWTTTRCGEAQAVLLAFGTSEDFAAVKTRFGLETFSFQCGGPKQLLPGLANVPVSDLKIQETLSNALRNRALDAPTSQTLFVVHVGSSLQSTLGPSKGGVDFQAYHNQFQDQLGHVRYVVVLSSAAPSVVRQAVTQAITNPDGTAWY